MEEVFVYRDLDAADSWDAQGAVPETVNSMIHLIAEDGLTTVVVDDPEAREMKEILAAIKSSLRDDIHNVVAELEPV